MDIRVGNGYDTHPLIKGEELILGGIVIPHSKGIQGHSDNSFNYRFFIRGYFEKGYRVSLSIKQV